MIQIKPQFDVRGIVSAKSDKPVVLLDEAEVASLISRQRARGFIVGFIMAGLLQFPFAIAFVLRYLPYSLALLIPLPILAGLANGSHAAGRERRRLAKRDPRWCTRCGYSLFGLNASRCPECGTAFDADYVRRAFDGQLYESDVDNWFMRACGRFGQWVGIRILRRRRRTNYSSSRLSR